MLVGADGTIFAEAPNRVGAGDATQPLEFAVACWAANTIALDETGTL